MPTFGYTSVGANHTTAAVNMAVASRFAISETGDLSKLTAYLDGNVNVKGLVYSDSSGTPNALLGVTTPTNISSLGAWFDLTFGSPLNLSAGNYWLGVIGDASVGWQYDTPVSGNLLNFNASSNYTSPSDPWSGGTPLSDYVFSIYATYTPAGGFVPFPRPRGEHGGMHILSGGVNR